MLRIDNDNDLGNLLKKHKKYREEYFININEQGFQAELLGLFAPTFYGLALATISLEVMSNSLIKSGVLK